MIQGERGWTPSTHNVVWPWSPSSTAPILKNKTKKGSVFNIMCTLTLSTLLRCWLATCCLIAAIPVQNEDKMLAHPSPWRMLWLWVLCGIHSTAADRRSKAVSAECVTSLLVTCPAQSGDVTVWGVGLQDRKNLLGAPVIFTDFLLPSLVTKGVVAKAASERNF